MFTVILDARQGLAALLVQGLSGCRPEEIASIPADFISSMGLSQSLTPSRNNGFLNMFKLMQARSQDMVQQVLCLISCSPCGTYLIPQISQRSHAQQAWAP